ncbi:MAG: oxygen-independent coproporphyrinogen III oxidase [Pseudomonadota bacterium]
MTRIDRFREAGLFDSSAPRYTSYPPANHFAELEAETYKRWLRELPDGPISLYLHIPFCERLCWFCACRTQAVNGPGPVVSYLEVLEAEIARVAAALPAGVSVGRIHWGGGTPTILDAAQIARLAGQLRAAFRVEADAEFSVEIDPACVTPESLDALVEAGLTRASVGIQDFAPAVQDTIGRHQSFEQTRSVLAHLRAAGVASLNADLVYGLPRQTLKRLEATLAQIEELSPDRIALYGYAHVPWMSKRQKVIPEETLPDPVTRLGMAELSAQLLRDAGYQAIGIDHFAKPEDGLARAARSGHLRRNFQGYTDDLMGALIGLGASSISRMPQGYAQNAPATPAYTERVEAGLLPVTRGYALSAEDSLRSRAIELLMCEFALNFGGLAREMGASVDHLRAIAAETAVRWPEAVTWQEDTLTIRPEGVPLTRLIAQSFDMFSAPGAQGRHSQAI